MQLPKSVIGYLRHFLPGGSVLQAKETTLSFIKGKDAAEMDELARSFFQSYLPKHLFEDAKSEMLRLKAEGWTIVVVSASAEVYMRVLPEFLPIDAVLSTSCEAEHGRYTGRIAVNCRGEEKVKRAAAWLHENDPLSKLSDCAAYGDSDGDLLLLSVVGTANAVNAKKSLRSSFTTARFLSWK